MFFKKLFAIVLSSFLLISCGSDEGSALKGGVPAGETDQGSGAVKSPFFWEVKKEGKVSYLLGTIHYGVSVHELLCSEVILEKLRGSDLFFAERVQVSAMPFSQKIDQIQKGIAPEEDEQLLSPELFLPNNAHFEQLSPASQEFILQKDLPKNLSYFGFTAGLSVVCVKEMVGIDISVAMDKEIQEMAQNQQIPLKALDEKSLVRDLDIYTARDVEWGVEDYPKWCNESMKEDYSDYKNGYISPDMEADESKSIFKDRNEKWLPKFMSAHSQYDRIFLIAGYGHFIARDNLIDMLRSEGFFVERVSCQ